MISQIDFSSKCLNSYCPRGQRKAKNCKLLSKQERCYQKVVESTTYNREETKKRQKVAKEVDRRDLKGCLALKILNNKEIQEIVSDFSTSLWKQSRKDKAHIIPKSKYPQFEYDSDNIITLSRFFHEKLDNYQDLITGEFIGEEGRKKWIERIMHLNNLWPQTLTYDTFLENKLSKGELNG